ncbi:asparagine synthase (glutamine-hydrolyzing) [Myxococcota bacterium]|nr:asparagine synthase (glutamine-hydrolyzing) [Myxococcota bacterium]
MCGIAGFVNPEGPSPADPRILARMVRSLAHRGPDDEGSWTGDGAFLGHRRLSVIDLEGGHQPMTGEDGRVVAVFNGEIYNHRAIREDLQRRGHVFRTRSDTEVLVHGWEEEGHAFWQRIQGMFALAIWDARTRTLVLVRDRMGKKPLYYGLPGREVVFASELRAMMVHPAVPREVDPEALWRLLVMESVPAPRAILRGVRKVPPGGVVEWRDGQVREWLWYRLQPGALGEAAPRTEDEALARIEATLVRAVDDRLETEVPLGVFLSGGLDSTAVLWALTRLRDPATLDTYTIGFEDPSYDESGPAREVARFLGTRHHEEVLGPRAAVDLVRRVPDLADEPLADPSLIPTHLLSRFARRSVTVALSGDGGDELFYGYPTFLADSLARRLVRWVPRRVWEQWLPRWVDGLPVSDRDMSRDFRARRLVRGLPFSPARRHFAWIGGFLPQDAFGVLSPEVRRALPDPDEDPFPEVDRWQEVCGGGEDLRTIACLYARLYLGDGVLTKVDRASMAVGLEVRSPLLDTRMVELAFSLPSEWSLRGATTKRLLRRMLEGRVPRSILRRPKKGFGIPLSRWIREDLRPLVEEHLSPDRLRREGFFDPGAVRALVEAHLSGRRNHRKEIYPLLVFQLWLSRHLL